MLSWTDIVQEGLVEYIDVNEEETAMIAMYVLTEHICTNFTPFSSFFFFLQIFII